MSGLSADRIVELLAESLKDRRVRLRRSSRHRAWDVQRRVARHSQTEELVEALRMATVKNGNVDMRVAGLLCYTLGRKGSKEAVPTLISLLDHEELRDEAVDALWHIEDSRACRHLLPLFQQEQDPGMRRLYALALGSCYCRAATDTLVSALKDSDSAVRGYAALSLGIIGLPKTEPAIQKALAVEPESYHTQLMHKGLELLHTNLAKERLLAVEVETYDAEVKRQSNLAETLVALCWIADSYGYIAVKADMNEVSHTLVDWGYDSLEAAEQAAIAKIWATENNTEPLPAQLP